jgi:hypothetical protein
MACLVHSQSGAHGRLYGRLGVAATHSDNATLPLARPCTCHPRDVTPWVAHAAPSETCDALYRTAAVAHTARANHKYITAYARLFLPWLRSTLVEALRLRAVRTSLPANTMRLIPITSMVASVRGCARSPKRGDAS